MLPPRQKAATGNVCLGNKTNLAIWSFHTNKPKKSIKSCRAQIQHKTQQIKGKAWGEIGTIYCAEGGSAHRLGPWWAGTLLGGRGASRRRGRTAGRRAGSPSSAAVGAASPSGLSAPPSGIPSYCPGSWPGRDGRKTTHAGSG